MQPPLEESGRPVRVSEADMQSAHNHVYTAHAVKVEKQQALEDAKSYLRMTEYQQRRLKGEILHNERLLRLRAFFDRTTTRIGGVLNIILIASAIALVLTSWLEWSFFWCGVSTAIVSLMAWFWGLGVLAHTDEEIEENSVIVVLRAAPKTPPCQATRALA